MSKKKKKYASGGANMLLGEGGFAHLPSESVMREYPKLRFDSWVSDYDTPEGIDRQINEDAMKAKANKKHARY